MILVTGGTGLIGSHLLFHLLKKNENVRAIYRSEESKQTTREIFSLYEDRSGLYKKISWIKGDILDVSFLETAMDGIGLVYHCAAAVSYEKSHEEMIMKVNIEGTANMVNASLNAGIKKFCHLSSIASFGRAARNEMVTELTHWDNTGTPSNYAFSKYYGELEVWRAIQEGLKTVIVNPAVVLGSGNWNRGSSALFNRVWNGLPYYTQGMNGYVDVIDVVNCMIQLMESDICNERFLLVSENISYEDLFTSIASDLNKKKPTIKVNRFLAKLAQWQDGIRSKMTGKAPVITKETVKIAFDRQRYSNEKVKKALSYDFRPLDETITRISNDLKKYHLTSTPS